MNIKIVGKHADLIMSRLKSFNLKDADGVKGDSVTLVINSADISGLPPKGEEYQIFFDDVDRGRFSISQRKFSINPKDITLVMTALPLNVKDTEFRERKSGSWNKAKLNELVKEVLPVGKPFFVHTALANIVIEQVDRTDESAPSFLNRVADKFDAIAKIVDGIYVVAPKGQTKTAAGKKVETITYSLADFDDLSGSDAINITGDLDGRNEFSGVKAYYSNTADGSRVMVSKGSAPFKTLASDANNESEAIQACATELRRIGRNSNKIAINAIPDSKAFAEGVVVLDDTFDSAISGSYSIDDVTFTGEGQQVKTMMINATLTAG